MAKKVKFPLDMGNEVYVRTLEELKENYDTEKVTEYFLEGRLLTWLNDRYYEEEAAAVGELAESGDKENLAARLGKIIGVEIQDDVDVENLEIRREKLDKLRQITADDEILDNADSVAFSQEELGDLLDEEKEVIYLCGDKFRIPLGVKNVKYIGVNNPTVTISGKGEIDLEASGIVFEKCEFSDDTKARFAVKEENKKIVEHKDIAINKDPLHLKNGEDEAHAINYFVDKYLINPTPFTAEQDNIVRLFGDGDRIILGSIYLNFTEKNEGKYFLKAAPAQSKYAAEAIEKHKHILCYTDDNKEAIFSGCLFEIRYPTSLGNIHPGNSGYADFYIKPEKYTEFLEKFAVTSLIEVPCKENVKILTLDCMIHKYNDTANHNTSLPFFNRPIVTPLQKIIPYIYIDMEKVVDDICQKLGKKDRTFERMSGEWKSEYDLGDYGIYMSSPIDWYSNISDLKFGNGSFYIDDKIKEIEEEYAIKAFNGFDLSKLKN